MAYPTDVLAEIQRGKSFLSGLDAEDTLNLTKGCDDCSVKNYDCLSSIMFSLSMKVELDEYDEVAIALINKMLLIIGDYVTQTPPTVNAGANKSIVVGNSTTFTATATAGSSDIVSYLWTKTSGGAVTMVNTTTPVLGVSDFGVGNFDFQVTVTDANGLSASDTVRLTGVADTSGLGRWGIGAMPTSYSEILAGTTFAFTLGADVTVPLNVPTYSDWWFWLPATQTIKNKYQDTQFPVNNGDIGTADDLLNYPRFVAGTIDGFVYYTNYPVPQPNSMIMSGNVSVPTGKWLTLAITGLPDDYEVYVSSVLWVNQQKNFTTGTILYDLTPVISGYTLSPVSVASTTMDANKTLTFTATPI